MNIPRAHAHFRSLLAAVVASALVLLAFNGVQPARAQAATADGVSSNLQAGKRGTVLVPWVLNTTDPPA